jgi:hypothetical protein
MRRFWVPQRFASFSRSPAASATATRSARKSKIKPVAPGTLYWILEQLMIDT